MYHDNCGKLSAHQTLLSNMYHDNEVGSLLTTPCCLTCTMITEVGTLLTTPCYLTCTMVTGRLAAHHILLPNMYHDNRGRLSPYHTLLPNMYNDNRGKLFAHHTLLLNMYHYNMQALCSPHLAIKHVIVLVVLCHPIYDIIISFKHKKR